MISGNVRLIDKNNKLVGVLPLDEARRRAVSTVQDLVLINADSSPAVCRILNYSEEMGTRFMKEIIAGEADKRSLYMFKCRREVAQSFYKDVETQHQDILPRFAR